MRRSPSESESEPRRQPGQRVLLDADIAAIYGVTTKRLNEQVKRNPDRFPGDFMFQLRALQVCNVSTLQRFTLATTKARD
jgi:hypothetical protein